MNTKSNSLSILPAKCKILTHVAWQSKNLFCHASDNTDLDIQIPPVEKHMNQQIKYSTTKKWKFGIAELLLCAHCAFFAYFVDKSKI